MNDSSEVQKNTSSVEIAERSNVKELLLPINLPEAGFQSYEMLKNNAHEQRDAFFAGDIVNPTLEYSEFKDLSGLDRGMLKLYATVEEVRAREPDTEKADIIASTLGFRATEMEYIKLLARLDFLTKEGGSEEQIRELVHGARELGEHLYGKPEAEVRDAALAEVWYQLDNMDLTPAAKKLYDELNNGFTWGDRQISGLPRPESTERLPDINDPALAWAGEVVLEQHTDIVTVVSTFWQQKKAELGDTYTATPLDVYQAFVDVLNRMDPGGESGVRIILDPMAMTLSWETPLMAVKVGAKREAIETQEELLQKILHELVVHGGRSINGIKSELPVLGTGLYSETMRPDYLTFEEGFASIIEAAISTEVQNWDGIKMGQYLDISLAESGADFRETYEKAWRYSVLLDLKDGQEVDTALLDKHKKKAYLTAVRIFRGTPIDLTTILPGETPLTFNKDLAYLAGRVMAINYIKKLYETKDEAGLMRLFKAKFDPTIPEQDAIAEKYAVTAE